MKYDYFKIIKFSTILKKINRFKDKFSRIYENIESTLSSFTNVFGIISKFIFSKIKNVTKIYKYLDLRGYNYSKIYRSLNFKRYKYLPLYVFGIITLSILIYLNIPLFFSYEKSELENKICTNFNAECSISGKVKYRFFPTPRIKIEDLIIKDFINKKKNLGIIKDVAIKLPLNNLLNKEKLVFSKIELKKAKINFDLGQLDKYRKFFKKKFNSKPIKLSNSKILFLDGKKEITTITNINLKYKTNDERDNLIFTGIFLDEDIYFNLKNKKNKKDPLKILNLKVLNSKTKVNIFSSNQDKNLINGNISFKKNKNKFTSTFDYHDDKIVLNKANLKNDFLDGKLNGEVKFLPYFNFNLNVDLNGINFNTLHGNVVALDDKSKKNLLKIDKKINGQLNITANKIFSKRTLIDSFESRMRFVNGNILIDQLLLNMGKLGAADVVGIVKNDEKFSNLKFESNIFFDNLKYFYNKFSIYNKGDISSSLFISGNFDLVKLQLLLNEISGDKKYKDDEMTYFQNEFNDIVLKEGYESLFNFVKFKEFVKLILTDTN